LVIVSRQHPDLYVYLRDRLEGDVDVDVVLDRRLGERRGERRHQGRRLRQEVDEHLRLRSHVILELP
jgi:hypothetical protein